MSLFPDCWELYRFKLQRKSTKECGGTDCTSNVELDGTWDVDSAQCHGEPIDVKGVVFAHGILIADDGREAQSARYSLDNSTTPNWLEIKCDKETLKGIYSLQGQTLRLSLGKYRPNDFQSPSDHSFTLHRRTAKESMGEE